MILLFVGDIMLGRLVNEALKHEPPEFPWGNTLSIFQNADWRVCNLECILSDIGEPWSYTPKVFHFRSDAKNVAVLQAANINAVSLANNHVLDYDYDAMFTMIKILDHHHILHAGADEDLDRAARPAISKVGTDKIGLIAFTDNEPAWEAADIEPGVFYIPLDIIDINDDRVDKLLDVIKETKKKVDWLVVSAHWGA